MSDMMTEHTATWIATAKCIAQGHPGAGWAGLTEREVEWAVTVDEAEVPPAHTWKELLERCPHGDIEMWPYCFILNDHISETVLARVCGGDGHMYWTVESPWGVGDEYDPSDEFDATRYYVAECQRVRANLAHHDDGWDRPG